MDRPRLAGAMVAGGLAAAGGAILLSRIAGWIAPDLQPRGQTPSIQFNAYTVGLAAIPAVAVLVCVGWTHWRFMGRTPASLGRGAAAGVFGALLAFPVSAFAYALLLYGATLATEAHPEQFMGPGSVILLALIGTLAGGATFAPLGLPLAALAGAAGTWAMRRLTRPPLTP